MTAHIRRSDSAEQSLEEHSQSVSRLCGRYARPLGLEKTAALIGLMHDMGKATRDFAQYLRTPAKAAVRPASPHAHAPIGAAYAYERWFRNDDERSRRLAAQCVSLCIFGHHAGLCDCLDRTGKSPYADAMKHERSSRHYGEATTAFLRGVASVDELDALYESACAEVGAFVFRASADAVPRERHFRQGMLCRLLLSILVDADRWDAACFEYGRSALAEEPVPDWQRLLNTFDAYRTAHLTGTGPIDRIRASIAEDCFARAADAPGIVTLTVPTGGGKTFSSLRYALKHAAVNRHRRIFYIIPYNTILDQNARDIRAALGDDPSILEHHANVVVEPEGGKTREEAEAQYRQLTERWDSGIILTSLVQFLNACYTSSNTDVRRMHRLTNAILIFDEVQSLPRHCKTLFEWAIGFLSACCGCTVVLCTATQPRLELSRKPTELMPNVDERYEQLRRVRYVPELDGGRTYASAALQIARLAQAHSVLAVVNTRRAAYSLYARTRASLAERGVRFAEVDASVSDAGLDSAVQAIPAGHVLCVYLSTLLCPAHRKGLIGWIKAFLKAGLRVLCFSTSLIEAGVNVSFPVVIRSLAGLPSIVQAAGRANRSMEYAEGLVYVWDFHEEELHCLKDVQQGANITRALLSVEGFADSMDMPDSLKCYFDREEDYVRGEKDYPCREAGGSLTELLSDNTARSTAAKGYRSTSTLVLRQSFREAGTRFEVIPQRSRAVIVPYREGRSIIEALRAAHDMQETIRLLRAAQAYTVALYDDQYRRLEQAGALLPVGESGAVALAEGYYDAQTGVRVDEI